jgi:hypothetical protein
MSTESPDNRGAPQQVNLQVIAQKFMAGLQQHFDMLAFNLAARESVQESAYKLHSSAPRIMPVAPRHQNFEQMQAYARDLLLRQVIGDCLNLAVTALNHAHFFLALVKNSQSQSAVSPASQQAAQASQQAFLAAAIDEKFNRLEQDYGVMCELEDSITSMGFMLQVLMQQGGLVKAEQLDDTGELVLELKAVELSQLVMDAAPPTGKLVDQRKVFHLDQVIELSDLELQLVLVTIASFADGLFKSVAQYAQAASQRSE